MFRYFQTADSIVRLSPPKNRLIVLFGSGRWPQKTPVDRAKKGRAHYNNVKREGYMTKTADCAHHDLVNSRQHATQSCKLACLRGVFFLTSSTTMQKSCPLMAAWSRRRGRRCCCCCYWAETRSCHDQSFHASGTCVSCPRVFVGFGTQL